MTKSAVAPIGHNKPPTLTETLREKHAQVFARLRSWKAKAARANLQPVTLEDVGKLEALWVEARDLANDANSIREREKQPFLEQGNEVDAVFNGGVRDELGTDQKKPGLARQIEQAAATRKLAITRAEQDRLAAEAARNSKVAEDLAAKAEAQNARGAIHQSDVTAGRAGAAQETAGRLEAAAAAPISQASKTTIGGVTSSVKVKMKVTGVVRATLDLEALRPYFKQDHLELAAQAALNMGVSDIKGVSAVEVAGLNARR